MAEQYTLDLQQVANQPANTTAPPADPIQTGFDKVNLGHTTLGDAAAATFYRRGQLPTAADEAGIVCVQSPSGVVLASNTGIATATNLLVSGGQGTSDNLVMMAGSTITRTDWSLVAGAPSLTAGVTYYVGLNGQLTSIAPTAVGEVVARVGFAQTPSVLVIDPAKPTLLTFVGADIKLVDRGAYFEQLQDSAGSGSVDPADITSLAISPANGQTVFPVAFQQVFGVSVRAAVVDRSNWTFSGGNVTLVGLPYAIESTDPITVQGVL